MVKLSGAMHSPQLSVDCWPRQAHEAAVAVVKVPAGGHAECHNSCSGRTPGLDELVYRAGGGVFWAFLGKNGGF